MGSNTNHKSELKNPEILFFLEIIIGMFASLYKSIGDGGSVQIEVVKQFLEEELDLNAEEYLVAVNIFHKAMQNFKSVKSYAIYFAETIGVAVLYGYGRWNARFA